MEQRRVRLGDIVDDYCTRERRVTNHAVVAMIEDQIQLTRCTTCDTEHPYKAARVPRRRKKTETGALYEHVLAGREDEGPTDVGAVTEARLAPPDADAEPDADALVAGRAPAVEPPDAGEPLVAAADGDAVPALEDGPVRRPLIRATLPRPEGQQVVRQPPEFTIRQSGGRGGGFRQDARGGSRNGRPAGGQGRGGHGGGQQRHGQRSGFGQGRSGSPHGGRQDRLAGQARHNRPSQHAPSGKKRSR